MANEFKVKNGLIVIGDLTTSGTITINGALAATQSWVTSQGYLTSASLSGYATQSYVTSAIAALVDSAPAALDTLNELAAALGDDANFSTTITNSIASKQSQLNGTGLVRMSGTSVSYDNTTYLISNFGNIEGDHTYGYPSSNGWYKIAEVVFNGACQSYNLWGEYRDTGYFDNSHFRIHITARAECDFPSNNESHAINVNIYGSSTNDTYFSNNVRVVLTQSSSNYRKYELQYYRETWDTGSWRLQTIGWTVYQTSQTAGSATGTPRVYYVSKFSTDNIFVANKISIGTTYAGFAANIAGTTYIIGASAWVNDGYGITNASSPGTGFFPYSDGNSVISSNNTTRLFVNGSTGNIGIGTSSPGKTLDIVGEIRTSGRATFNEYVNTGFVYGNTDLVLAYSGGTTGILINSSGNVGIGTTNPGGKLEVKTGGTSGWDKLVVTNTTLWGDGSTQYVTIGAGGATGIMMFNPHVVWNSASGTAALRLGRSGGVSSGSWYEVGTGASDSFFIAKDGFYQGPQLYINSAGNIGIGTTSPASKLQVAGDIRIQNETGLITDYGPLVGRYNTSQVYVGTGGSYSIVKIARADGGALNVLSGGNVGIGTDSPNYKLDVNGSINIFSGNSLRWGSGDAEIINSGYNLLFKTYNGSALSEAMRINSAGKVSIGTTDTNSNKSDFTVYTGSGASLVLTDDQVRMGGADVNWGVALRSYGALQTYGQVLYLTTQAGNYAVNVQPNGVTSAQFYQSETYINTYTKINYNWGGGDHGAEAFTIQGTYPSITLRSTNADFKWLLHTDASGNFRWYTGSIYNNNTWTNRFTFGIDNNFYVDSGHIYAATGNSTQWNTAYSWGNHASAGYQAAATAITTSNIGSQSVSYANSAGSAGQVTNQTGQLLRYDNRVISPSETTAGYLQFGFTSWANDNSAPYADYLHMRSYTDGSGGTDNLVMFKKSGIGMRIYQQTFESTTPYADYVDVWTTANFTSTNVSNWNTAYGWGNHASAGYATTSYVTTQINNLINGAPGALDTLDELAAALGDDSNFATTVTNSIAGKVSKSGDTMTGALTLNAGLNAYASPIYVNEIRFRDTAGSPQSDPYSMRWISEASARGAGNSWLEFQLNDDNNEEIRIYGNSCVGYGCGSVSENLYHVFRADGYAWHAGNLVVVGTISASGYNSGNWDTAYGWGNHASAGYALNSALANYLPLSGGSIGGALTVNGNLTVNGTITENSSIKLKENVETSEGNLEKVVNLRPVTYNKIGSQTTELGLIAEEVAEVYPEFVQYDENGEPIGVHYSRLTAALIGAVKELTNQVQELKRNK